MSLNRTLANLINTDGDVKAANLDLAASGGSLTMYDSIGLLPLSGVDSGSMAFVNSSNRMYVSNGQGWYSATIVNNTPTWITEPSASLSIVDSATALVVNAVASDSEGIPITYSGVVSDSAQYLVTISQDSSSFTFTPKSSSDVFAAATAGNLDDSNGGSFTYTFKASDGINILSKQSTVNYSGLTQPSLLLGYGSNALYTYSDITFTKSIALLNGATSGAGLFDNSTSGQLHGAQYATGYVQFEFPVAVKITKYHFFERAYSGNSTNDAMRFKVWDLQGSNDNSNWTTLHNASEGTTHSRPSKPASVSDIYGTYTDGLNVTSHGLDFDVTNGTYYTYYRVNLSSVTNNYGVVGEIAFYGK